ncbi:MAG: histidine kinase [Bacteroidota bacterium]
MSFARSFGLQWRLAAIQLLAGLVIPGLVVAVYIAGTSLGLQPAPALGAGFALGATAGFAGTVIVYISARPMKRRLREAGDMAGRIARGQFGARVSPGPPDEIGWLEEQLNKMAAHLETAVMELRTLAEQNRRLAEEARRGATLEERARLARDLHDTVNQQLFVLAMRAAAARRNLEQAGGAPALAAELAALEDLARQAHAETRELVLQLRPVTLSEQGLGPALREYARAVGAQEGFEVMLEIDTSVRVGGAAGETMFRVAQEALNNISKHAQARRVRVGLARTAAGITLAIGDDGVGFEPKAALRPTAVGLAGMRERVAAAGGKLSVASSPGRGTEITVILPVDTEGENPS